MNKTGVIGVIVALIVGVGVAGTVYVVNQSMQSPQASSEETESVTSSPTESETTPESDAQVATTIVFTNDGFEKDSYTVKAGETVKVMNNSDTSVQFSSDDHPTHRENPEINLPTISAGESTTFTPQQKGTFGVHDHIQSQFTTTLEVQ
jgi:plastocyanin